MPPQRRIEDRFIKIYLLVHLTKEERTAYLDTFETQIGEDPNLTWVKPQLVDWPADHQEEGSIEGDLLRLYKQNKVADSPARNFQYFADRQSLETGTVILAHRDVYTFLHSPQAAQEITNLAAAVGITLPQDWTLMDGVVENLIDDLTSRGVAWGRIPISQWRLSWCNFDIHNMGEDEYIEYICGGSSVVLRDPDWDEGGFLERLREEVRGWEEEPARAVYLRAIPSP